MKKIILVLVAIPILSGCMSARIKPGAATVNAGPGVSAQFVQSQDPKQPSAQTVDTETTVSRVLPPGLIYTPAGPVQSAPVQADSRPAVSHQAPAAAGPVTAPPVIETTRTHSIIKTTIGASQPNTAAEIAAKLASVRWLQWAGLLFIVFGAASLFYPPLRLIVNSVTTSAWCIAGGAAMIFLPLIIVGHEVLILAIAAGIAALWFFAHRHGAAQSELATIKKIFVGDNPPPPAPPPPK